MFVFDLGGTHLRCAIVVDEQLTAIETYKVNSFLSGLTPSIVAQGVVELVARYVRQKGSGLADNAPVVMAYPGPVAGRDSVLVAPTLYGAEHAEIPDLVGLLKMRLSRPVYVLNDMSAIAWALSRISTAQRFIVVTVSSGIGSKIFDRAHPQGVIDDPPFAGEIGHMVVDASPNGPLCDCGARGHLGAVSSGRALERWARSYLQDSTLENAAGLVPAIVRREAWAVAGLRMSIEPLAQVLLGVTMALGLEEVLVVGGFAQAVGSFYADLLNEEMRARSRYSVVHDQMGRIARVVGVNNHLGLTGALYCGLRRNAELEKVDGRQGRRCGR